MSIDHERWQMAISALFGGAFLGLYHFLSLLLAGQPITRQDAINVTANLVGGVVAGGLVAFFIGQAVRAMIPFAALRDVYGVGFMIGALAWELTPVLYKHAPELGDRLAAMFTGKGKA